MPPFQNLGYRFFNRQLGVVEQLGVISGFKRCGLPRSVSGVALKRLEDELDAYVCAYIGVYHLAWSGTRSLTVGDGKCGYIVTPVAPRHARSMRARALELGVRVS